MALVAGLILMAKLVEANDSFVIRIRDAIGVDTSCRKELRETYNVHRIDRVVDGDTIDVIVRTSHTLPQRHPGFTVTVSVDREMRLRLLGVDTPEKYGDTKAEGLKATNYTESWVLDKPLTVRYYGDGKFGRPLSVLCDRESCLNDDLISSGNAKYYCGGKRG